MIVDDGLIDLYCDNGGILIDNDYCVCLYGFIGIYCEICK